MQNRFIFTLLLLVSFTSLFAQGYKWSEQIGGPKDDKADYLVANDDGSLVTIGTFYDSVDVNPGPGVLMLHNNQGGESIFIQHTNAQGNLIWAGQIGGPGFARALAVCKDPGGNILISGTSGDTIDLDPGAGELKIFQDAAFVVQLNPQCSLMRAFKIDDIGSLNFNCIAVDAGGNLYVAGSFDGFYDFDPGPGTFFMASDQSVNQSPFDCFLLKLDANWNFAWAKEWGGILSDAIFGISIDQEGMVYTCGRFSGTVDFDPGPAQTNLSTQNSDDSDGFFHKITPDGTFVWVKQMAGYGYCFIFDVKTDLNNNIILGGEYSGTCDFDPGPGTLQIPSLLGDMFLAKYDKSGNMLWARPVTASGDQTIRAFDVDELGDIYATGSIKSTTDIDPGPGELILTTAANMGVAILFKVDFLGNTVWGRQLSGSGASFGWGIHVAKNGTVYGSGQFTTQVNMRPGPNPVIYNSVGNYDVYVIKVNQDWNFYGNVFYDANANGIQDNGETGLRGNAVSATSGYATATTSTGAFHFYEDIAGDTIRVVANWPGWQYVPAFFIANQNSAMGFAAQGPPTVDLSITAVETQHFIPGFTTRVEIAITNLGTATASALPVTMTFQSPTVSQPLQFFASSLQPVAQMANSIDWVLPAINPGETQKIWVDFKTKTSVPIGAVLEISSSVSANNDAFNPNNNYNIQAIVTGSLDPNDKQVTPTAVPLQAMDTTDLHYVIRFQNTGTFPATFVVIRDTLPSTLDLATLKVTASSHPNTWRLFGSRVLEFRFDPIILPDSSSDETGSHGFVAFTVQGKPGLPLNTLIQNRAAIYFDYNDPVITNTAEMHVGTSVSAFWPADREGMEFSIFPNPASAYSKVEIKLPEMRAPDLSVQLLDAAGRIIQQYDNLAGKSMLNLTGLSAGTYFVQLRAGSLMGGKVLTIK